MARMRSLKPEFWLDRKLARSLSRDERMLYLGLWNQADEHARAQADPRLVKGQIFPYDDDLTDDVIATMLKALEVAGVVKLYDVDGDPYMFLPKLAAHQRLEPAKVPSRHPAPPDLESPADVRANESARRADETAPGDNSSALKHVAGSMEHEAGSRGADRTAPRRGRASDDGFAAFWAAYPRKEAKRRAEQAWRAALKRVDQDTIMAGLERFQFPEDRQFIPLPASWLNADRWADQPPPAAAASASLPSWEL